MSDDRHRIGGNRAPRFVSERIDLSRREIQGLFKDFDSIKVAPSGEAYLIVKMPYDPYLNEQLKKLRAQFVPKSKTWKVRVAYYESLLELAPQIEEANKGAWADDVNAGLREDMKDRRIVVPLEEARSLQLDELMFYQGEEWVVSYIGRATEVDGKDMCNVYLAKPEPISSQVETEFSSNS